MQVLVKVGKMEFNKMGLFMMLLLFISCIREEDPVNHDPSPAYRKTITATYNGTSVDVVIDKPAGDRFDVLMVFHGTVNFDHLILQAANNSLNVFSGILDRKDMMIVSVAYPEENLLFGDNIRHCEAALLWLKNEADDELGVHVKKIFLAGHSQGGYLVTRLNTMHATDGVIANAPGPLNLLYRCQLEENGQVPGSPQCTLLRDHYGPTADQPAAYSARSLLNFTSDFKTDILFVQGLEDSPIQMYSWSTFREAVSNCTNCQEIQFVELPEIGHNALFNSPQAKTAFNAFINARIR
jgi:hypothetical protein